MWVSACVCVSACVRVWPARWICRWFAECPRSSTRQSQDVRWRLIATDPSLLAAHAARRPIEMISCILHPRSQISCKFSTLEAARRRWKLLDNPITRQWTNLPALVPHPCFTALTCSFYLHVPSGEYRLLCHGLEQGAAASSRHYGVLVAHRGILHWFQHPEATSTSKILSFDTVSKTFRLMSRPLERGGGGDTTRSLLELDGELAVANMQGEASLDIWALRDYEAEIWTLRHRVEVPPPTCSRYYDVL
uniref:Uncharacterized protein n=1 Tax=Setaria italica TaxID=4555 RepID=K4AMU4_SETIT